MEYRFARPEEENDLLDLINFVFSQSARPHDFAAMIPKVYAHPGFAPLHAVAAEENGALRAAVGRQPLQICLGEDTLRAGYIGSVAVHPRFRGQGHMKALMAFQERDARARGYDLLALGGRRQRYGYFGFTPFGAEIRFHFNQANVRHALPHDPIVTLEKVGGPDHPALGFMKTLHDRQPFHYHRPAERLYDTLRTYSQQPYVIVSQKSGGYVGYLTELNDQMLELVLTEEGYLPHVLSAWMGDRKNGQVLCPDWNRARVKQLFSVAENYTVSDSELMKVLNWERVLRITFRFRAGIAPVSDGKRILQIENAGTFALSVQNGQASVSPANDVPDLRLSEQQAVSLLFSPLQNFLTDDPLLKSWLPLSLDVPVADQF